MKTKEWQLTMLARLILNAALCCSFSICASQSLGATPYVAKQKWKEFEEVLVQKFDNPAHDAILKNEPSKAISLYNAASAACLARPFEQSSTEWCYYKAQGYLREAASLERQNHQYEQAVKTYLRSGEIDARLSKQFPASHSHPFGSLPDVAEVYVEAREFDKAEKAYIAVLKLAEPRYASVYGLDLARVYELTGDLNSAQKAAEECVRQGIVSRSFQQVRSARFYLIGILKKQHKTADIQKLENALQDKHCPVCGNTDKVSAISYGMPSPWFQPPAGTHLGGCGNYPEKVIWWCERDQVEF